MRVLALAFVLIAVAPAGQATAASVRLVANPAADRYETSYAVVEYVAGPGEINAVTTSTGPGLTVRDPGAVILAGDGCVAVSPHEARCEMAGFPIWFIDVQAGDMDDTVTLGGDTPIADADGGPGDDVLRASDNDGTLTGGDGRDTLVGGAGGDTLTGGAGPDALHGAGGADYLRGEVATGTSAPEADLLDGGDGSDTVSYETHREPVVVDLADPATDGADGEGDVLRDVENVTGGRGADIIRGDDGPNVLVGQAYGTTAPGSDRLVGRGGDDWLRGFGGADALVGGSGADSLFAGPGRDRVSGGPGDDLISLHDDRRDLDSAACGEGADRVLGPRARDRVGGDCEQVEYYPLRSGYPRASPRRVLVRVTATNRICAITVRLDRPSGRRDWEEIGRGSVRVPDGDRTERLLRVRLDRAGRRYLARRGKQRVRVTLGYIDGRCAARRRYRAGSYVTRL